MSADIDPELPHMDATPGTNVDTRPPFWRITTGSVQADEILGGGFPANSINIVMGQPGTGKTIFAEQLLFHNAAVMHPLLYLTTVSEPLAKVLSYAQRFGFFNLEDVGTRVFYEDLGPELATKGPEVLVPRVIEAIKTMSPRMIIIDSFKAVQDLADSPQVMRRLVSNLAGILSAYEVTAFLVGEYTSEDMTACPEFSVADSIIQLERHPLGARDERFFRVLKLRGSGYQEGQHAFALTDSGLKIYPRLVTPRFEEYAPLLDRTPTGIDGLDALMGGGVWRGSTTLVVGPTGSGKTTMGLHFALEGIRRGEPTLYVNFQENPAQIRRLVTALGVGSEETARLGLHHLYRSPVELQIDSVIVEIFETIREQGIRRVVVDAVGDLATAASDPRRLHDYLYSLVQHLVVRNVTSFLMFESVAGITGMSEQEQRFSYMSDNLIVLTHPQGDHGPRTLHVVKTRNSDHDPRPHELEITADGVRVR